MPSQRQGCTASEPRVARGHEYQNQNRCARRKAKLSQNELWLSLKAQGETASDGGVSLYRWLRAEPGVPRRKCRFERPSRVCRAESFFALFMPELVGFGADFLWAMEHDEVLHSQRDDQKARGGGLDSVVEELIPGLDFFDCDVDSVNMDEPDLDGGALPGAVQLDIKGSIDGSLHIAAFTCGDGACGLHAVWGSCHRAGSSLFCEKAREKLLEAAPSSHVDFCRLHGGVLRGAFLELLRDVWVDQALPAARAICRTGSFNACPEWVRTLWSSLPRHVQDTYSP